MFALGVGLFGIFFVLIGLFIAGVFVYVIVANVTRYRATKELAIRNGADPSTAKGLALGSSLEATYLASQLKPGARDQRPASERLTELQSLLGQGLITQAEFDERRAAIVNGI